MNKSLRFLIILSIFFLISTLLSSLAITPANAWMTLPLCKSEESSTNSVFQISQGYISSDTITGEYQNLGIDYVLSTPTSNKEFTVVAEDDGTIPAEFPPIRWGTGGNITIAVGNPSYPKYYIFNNNILGLADYKAGDVIHRGQILGKSNDLHVSVRGNGPLYDDPYVLYTYAPDYPNPDGTNGKLSGQGNYWTTNPPSYFCQ